MTQRRRGFTLVELLVVIAIIGILVAMLLPAVQSARESARRLQCGNNVKQLALALANYQVSQQVFPPSSHWNLAGGADTGISNASILNENWCIMVLPFLEQQNLYDKFDRKLSIAHANNAVPRGTRLAAMMCPSDPYNRQPFNGSASSTTNQMGDGWARGNYAGNASLGALNAAALCAGAGGLSNCAAFADSPGWRAKELRGVMGANTSVGAAGIHDGSSNTILLAEMRAGVHSSDTRGIWAMSGGASSLWGHGTFMGDGNGPNSSGIGGDNVPACQTIVTSFGCSTWDNCPALAKENMTCFPLQHNQQSARGLHPGGILVGLCDGSVHFISNFIDISGNVVNDPSVWDRLNTSSDGYPIDAAAF